MQNRLEVTDVVDRITYTEAKVGGIPVHVYRGSFVVAFGMIDKEQQMVARGLGIDSIKR